MPREVTEIPATLTYSQTSKQRKCLRVAAYCRVSTEEEEQQNSFEVQVRYYTEKITNHEGWLLAGIFADDGISGVRTKNRDQFNEMIELCRQGKIDLILTKSISRFARNTLDCIHYVRLLKSWGIPVIFEKECIDTSNMNSEMILTCLSSFAQAESESISGNVTKGIRMGYRQGRFAFRYTNCLGYRKGADGKPEIVPEEARVIRLIAQDFLNGESLHTIKLTLEGLGVRSPSGNITWSTQTIQRILQNEKYVGDVLLQKTYTADFLEGKVKKNNGELPQYYIRDNHPAILTREEFAQIQEELARRRSKRPANAKSKTNKGRFTSKYALSERLVCGSCGSPYRRVTWNIHGRKEIVWRRVNRSENGKAGCPNSPSIPEEELHQAILEAVRSLAEGHQEEMARTLENSLVRPASPEEDTDSKLAQLEGEFDRLLAQAGEDDTLDIQLQQVSTEILFLKKRREQAEKAAQRSQAQQSKREELRRLLEEEELNLTQYEDTLTFRIVERVTVVSRDEMQIRFVGGVEKRAFLRKFPR